MSGTPPAASEAEAERVFGLLLFEAEETLARGQVEKALVLASRAVRERPGSLTARSLFDRTRREMTRGRRREKLEARIVEARSSIETGDYAAAEKIIATVLKLLPDHEDALQLFALLKHRRLRSGTVEAEAERELDAMMAVRARQAATRARAALAAGWSFRALMTVRRALVLSPDDKDLLDLYHESLREVEKGAGERAMRRAAHARVLAARGRLSRGEAAAAATILREVLKEDKGNPEARRALAEMERVVASAKPREPESPGVITGRFTHRKLDAPAPMAQAPRAPAAAPTPRGTRPPAWALAAGGVAVILGTAIVFAGRWGGSPAVPPPAAAAPRGIVAAGAAASDDPVVPEVLASEPPALAAAVLDAISRYARAIETMDARLLAEARPDLTEQERTQILARYEGSANVATDLRVQAVARRGNRATISIVRADAIAGRSEPPPPVTESWRFDRDPGGAWVLRSAR